MFQGDKANIYWTILFLPSPYLNICMSAYMNKKVYRPNVVKCVVNVNYE